MWQVFPSVRDRTLRRLITDNVLRRNNTANNSLAISSFTMPAALAAADKLLDNPEWVALPSNLDQVNWLASFRRRARLALSMPEIQRNATTSCAEHVAWLASQGWDASITQGSPADVFLAATLNIVAKWQEAGRPYVQHGIDRVHLVKGVVTSPSRRGEHRVAEVTTQHPSFSFCFQQVDTPPADRAALAAQAFDLVTRPASERAHLDFPMVDLRVKDDARYMLGLHAGPNYVAQAAEQLRLELNETGGRASAAAEVAVTRGGPRIPTIRIDGPFILAINRNGAPPDSDKVVFAAYVDRDAWRKPADGRI